MEACVIGLLLFCVKNLSVVCVLWQKESQLHIHFLILSLEQGKG